MLTSCCRVRLAETKRFQGRRVVQLEFGGQHALLLAVPKQAPNGAVPGQTVAAAAPDASASAAAAPAAAKEAEADQRPWVWSLNRHLGRRLQQRRLTARLQQPRVAFSRAGSTQMASPWPMVSAK